MDALTCLMTRRSIRRYGGEPVTGPQLEQIAKAALQSPSAFDCRPWEFAVLRDRERLRRLERAMPHCEMLAEAAAGFLVCGAPAREKVPGFWIQDCSAASQNVLLAAHALGLGACWIGLHPVEERESAVRRLLNVPEDLIPFSLISLGAPAEHPGFEDRWDAGRLHDDGW
jgi:nitroreductase